MQSSNSSFNQVEIIESWKTRIFRWGMNLYPLYFWTGGKILKISSDWKRLDLGLSLNFRTRNYVGTIFGGSLFSACDPFYMIMLIHILGPKYVVWDKAAAIKFKRPGKGKLIAHLEVTDAEIEAIKQHVSEAGELVQNRMIVWKNEAGSVVAEIERTLYIATREHYNAKRARDKAYIKTNA